MNTWRALIGFIFAASTSLALASTPGPDEIVKSTVQEVMGSLRTNTKIDTDGAIKLVQAKVLPYFDFQRLSAQALGRHWATATPEQQKRISSEFQTLLVRSYVNQLLANRNSSVEIKPSVAGSDGKSATIESIVTNPTTGKKITLAYGFNDSPNGWKVGNVSVEGISLVTSYRNSFNDVVRKDGIEGLIAKMHQKNTQAAP